MVRQTDRTIDRTIDRSFILYYTASLTRIYPLVMEEGTEKFYFHHVNPMVALKLGQIHQNLISNHHLSYTIHQVCLESINRTEKGH